MSSASLIQRLSPQSLTPNGRVLQVRADDDAHAVIFVDNSGPVVGTIAPFVYFLPQLLAFIPLLWICPYSGSLIWSATSKTDLLCSRYQKATF
jgi:hypothetical protein